MTTQVQTPVHPAATSSTLPTMCLIAGWLIPGAGHFLLKKPLRGALLFVAIVTMFAVGLGMQGKVYAPSTGDLLDILGFVGQLGGGLMILLAKVFGWGATSVLLATADYGTKSITCAGLLNVIAAVDAHSIANGRKAA